MKKLSIIFTLLVSFFLSSISKAQPGVNCASSISIPTGNTWADYTFHKGNNTVWLSFVADSARERIQITRPVSIADSPFAQITLIRLYGGSCSSLTAIDSCHNSSSSTDSLPALQELNLTRGNTYYISVTEAPTTTQSYFGLHKNPLYAIIIPVPCTNPVCNNINLLFNGDFENQPTWSSGITYEANSYTFKALANAHVGYGISAPNMRYDGGSFQGATSVGACTITNPTDLNYTDIYNIGTSMPGHFLQTAYSGSWFMGVDPPSDNCDDCSPNTGCSQGPINVPNYTATAWQQTISVTPGVTYLFTSYLENIDDPAYWASKGWGAPAGALVAININNNPTPYFQDYIKAPTYSSWHKVSFCWTAPPNTYSALIQITGMGDPSSIGFDFGLDNLSFYQVESPLIASASPQLLCNGSSTNLCVSNPNPSSTYVWTGNSIPPTTAPCITVSPTVTTTYTVTETTQAGCVSSVTVTVNVATITINGADAICAGTCTKCNSDDCKGSYTLQFTASELGFPCSSNSLTYAWSTSSTTGQLSYSGSNFKTFTVTVPNCDFADIDNGFTVSLTLCCPSPSNFCCTQTFAVSGCCIQPCLTMNDPIFSSNVLDRNTLNLKNINNGPGGLTGAPNIFPYPKFNFVVDSANTWVIEDINNKYTGCGYLIINGKVQVNQNLVIRNSEIQMGPDAKFVLAPGVTMTVENSHIHACSSMWVGIFVPNTASVYVIQGSLIEDAKEAIVSENGGYYNVFGSTLNKNHIGIYAEPHNGVHFGQIESSQISCNAIKSLLPPYNSSANVFLGPPINTISPYAAFRSSIGMLIDSVSAIGVGNIFTITPQNTNMFANLDYGINSNASSITVGNNDFNDYTPLANTPGFEGILAKGDASGTKTATIGILYPNTFEGWGTFTSGKSFAVLVRDSMSATIQSNDFTNNFGCVGIWSTYNNIVNVIYNHFNSFTFDGVFGYGNSSSRILISNNDFINTPIQTNATGVNLNDITSPDFYTVSGNGYTVPMTDMVNGITATNVSNPNINGNKMTLLNTGSPQNGIILYGCNLGNIDHNNVTAVSTPNNQDGIDIDFSSFYGAQVTCNTVTGTNVGCMFEGSPLFVSTFFAQNQMDNNGFAGLVMNNNGSVGAQGINCCDVNDNQWTNINTWATYCENSSPGTNSSPFYVRSGASYDPCCNGNDITSVTPITFTVIPTPVSAYDCNNNSGGGTGTTPGAALQIIHDSVSYGGHVNSARWMNKHALYKYLNNRGSSLLTVPAIRHFRDSVRKTNMGMLDSISTILGDTNGLSPADISAAAMLSSSITNPDTVEQTLQTVDNIIISMQSTGTNFPNTSQINTLRTIAPLCPALYGTGVFVARALLSTIDTAKYISSCELAATGSGNSNARIMHNKADNSSAINAIVYPNPNSGNMTLAYALNEGDNGKVVIYDLMGKELFSQTLNASSNTLSINSNLNDGVYIYSIFINDELSKTGKVVIIK